MTLNLLKLKIQIIFSDEEGNKIQNIKLIMMMINVKKIILILFVLYCFPVYQVKIYCMFT
jgi:hypothetical protein